MRMRSHMGMAKLIRAMMRVGSYLISITLPFCAYGICKVYAQNTLRWRHNGHDGVSRHQPHDCLPNCLFRRRSENTPKLCVTGLCAENSPVTGEFSAQKSSNAESVSIWWRHHERPFCSCLHTVRADIHGEGISGRQREPLHIAGIGRYSGHPVLSAISKLIEYITLFNRES